jgi:putative phosphoesterase
MAIVLGILSDSHGQRVRVRRAIELLLERGATRFVHLGDVGDGVLDELAGLNARVVFGNCDDDRELEGHARALDIEVMHPAGWFEIDGKRVGVTHGHLLDELDKLIEAKVDYLLHGHTHQCSDATIDGVRMINPGALHRATPHTAVLLCPATGAVETIVVT